jgi:phosphohistidine phosphatase SixA
MKLTQSLVPRRRGRLAWPLAAILALLTLGSWLSRAVGQQATAAPESRRAVSVVLVRHAEKGTDDPRDPSLSESGGQRAKALARLLQEAGVTHLYSTPYRRTRSTLAPLAAQLELSVAEYDPRALGAFAAQLAQLPPGSVAVVAGHSNTTPALYEALGGTARDLVESEHGPLLPETAYDRLYSITVSGGEGGAILTHAALELRYGR